MRKLIAFIFSLSFILTLTACTNAKETPHAVYSFYGEDGYFEISNGTIVLSDSEDIFYGGNLRVSPSSSISNITSYKATFYIKIVGQQKTIFANEFRNYSSAELVVIDLGKKVSKHPDISNQFKNIEEKNAKFWCELEVSDAEGNRNCYTIVLKLIQIT